VLDLSGTKSTKNVIELKEICELTGTCEPTVCINKMDAPDGSESKHEPSFPL